MDFFLRSISYILHPIFMPIIGALIYFSVAPRFIPEDIITLKISGLTIITILLPLLLFFILKNLGVISSFHLASIRQRKLLLLIQSTLFLVIIKVMIDVYNYPELYFFFLGILFSSLSAIFIVMFNIKASLHMVGIAAITMFTIAISIHFSINLTLLIGILIIGNGLVATSRLHYKAHSNLELILGFLLGFIPQLTLVNFWL